MPHFCRKSMALSQTYWVIKLDDRVGLFCDRLQVSLGGEVCARRCRLLNRSKGRGASDECGENKSKFHDGAERWKSGLGGRL